MSHQLLARVAVASVLVTTVVAAAVLAGSSPQKFRIPNCTRDPLPAAM